MSPDFLCVHKNVSIVNVQTWKKEDRMLTVWLNQGTSFMEGQLLNLMVKY